MVTQEPAMTGKSQSAVAADTTVVLLPASTVGSTLRLKKDEYNGRCGHIVSYDAKAGLYMVELNNRHLLSLKPD